MAGCKRQAASFAAVYVLSCCRLPFTGWPVPGLARPPGSDFQLRQNYRQSRSPYKRLAEMQRKLDDLIEVYPDKSRLEAICRLRRISQGVCRKDFRVSAYLSR